MYVASHIWINIASVQNYYIRSYVAIIAFCISHSKSHAVIKIVISITYIARLLMHA